MQLILAGIDEAGYGPLLGPLCVGMTVFEAPRPEGEGAPCLWKLLSRGICREAGRGGKAGTGGRIPIADSKQLKLSSSVTTTHPLVHLERAVLCAARCVESGGGGGAGAAADITSDRALFAALGAAVPPHRCYDGEDTPLPRCHDAASLAITSNVLRGVMDTANVRALALRCRVMGEAEFNGIVGDGGNKGATVGTAVAEHLRTLWDAYATLDAEGRPRLGVVCDRLGGRASYGGLLERAVPGAAVTVLEESPTRSRYIVEGGGRRMSVTFLVEAEQAHMPVALASMVAKYTRELCMERFNRAWNQTARDILGAEIKPTAGYSQDARRWLRDAKELLSREDREALMRKA